MGQVGYPGDVGAITGYSSAGVAISEKVWLHYKGSYAFEGAPTTYVLRELLQVRTHRPIQPELNALTCNVWSAFENAFEGPWAPLLWTAHEGLTAFACRVYSLRRIWRALRRA